MSAYIIEAKGEIKEAFHYDRPVSADSEKGILEYARATYGADATLRRMTEEEAANFALHGPDFFVKKN
ncbi:MAG TPA: hypothetical protein DC054_13870 [Blastocatellia bacterium]|nr:hypothetical protein [Blastocatellia bacterium]